MKVIFLRDIPHVARKYEVKEVSAGYAQNNLIPRKFAVPATPEHLRRLEKERATAVETEKEKEAHINELVQRSADAPLRMSLPANAKGHLFKGVHAGDIVGAIRAQYGVVVTEREILLKSPLKDVGTHAVEVAYGTRKGVCTVIIEAQ